MKDKLLFGTIGLLVGVVVMQWTMPTGQANVTVPNSGIIAVMDFNLGTSVYMLDQDGKVWTCEQGGTYWARRADWDPPMPVNQIKFWQPRGIVTTDNHAWIAEEVDNVLVWSDRGPWPGGVVATEQSTFGKVKAQYRAKGVKP